MAKKHKEQRAVAYDPDTEISADELEALPSVNLRLGKAPGRRMVSIRLREDVIDGLKGAARKRSIPYQVLLQMWLQERLQAEAEAQDREQPPPLVRLQRLSSELQEVVDGLFRSA